MSKKTCLLLNATYEPMIPVPVSKAVRLILDGKVEVLESDEKQFRSEKVAMPKPTVIRLKNFVHVPRNMRRQVTNTFLFARDDYTCAYCRRTEKQLRKHEALTRDHVIPRSKGGPDEWTNVVTACSPCNGRKDNRTPGEAGLTLHVTPTVPHFVHLKWSVRTLTEAQMKYVGMFFGDEVVAQLKKLAR